MFWSKPKKPVEDKSWTGRLIKIISKYGEKASTSTRKGVPEPLVKAFLAPTIYVMRADGERQPQEEIQLMAMLSTSPVMRGLSAKRFGEVIDEVSERLGLVGGKEDQNNMSKLLVDLPPALKTAAYAYAVRMAYADQQQTPEEEQALSDLRQWLNIDPAEADSITSTMRVLIAAPPIA